MGLSLLLFGCGAQERPAGEDTLIYSDIKADEQVVFFRTAGWLDEASQEWHLPIHGWIYEPENSELRKALFVRILEEQFDLVPDSNTEPNLDRRLNLLIADNERNKTITVNIAGRSHALPPSTENGHFNGTVVIPAGEARDFAEQGFIEYSAATRDPRVREFKGKVRLLKPAGLSIISDIDDTVKITAVTDTRRMLEQTFLLDFMAAPGMADLYGEWAADNVGFHYVSSSPWQLYSPLVEFLDASNFPWATFRLKTVRFRDETLLDLFKKGTETKPAIIETILDRYPERQFVLVGDSGEQDPEVYAALLRKHPQQILKAYIRNVTQETPDNPRFASVFEGVADDRWQLFDDPRTLVSPPGQQKAAAAE